MGIYEAAEIQSDKMNRERGKEEKGDEEEQDGGKNEEEVKQEPRHNVRTKRNKDNKERHHTGADFLL